MTRRPLILPSFSADAAAVMQRAHEQGHTVTQPPRPRTNRKRTQKVPESDLDRLNRRRRERGNTQ